MKQPIGNCDPEALKIRNAEKLFYKHVEMEDWSQCLFKTVPIAGVTVDLVYIKAGRSALFKFMDTTSDTFEILGEEIIEVMREEIDRLQRYQDESLGFAVPYYFVMPFVKLSDFGRADSFIIDQLRFEELINDECALDDWSVSVSGKEQDLLRMLGREFAVLVPALECSEEEPGKEMRYRGGAVSVYRMDDTQMAQINALRYGDTHIEGATGTGKTALLFAKAMKLARLYPNDRILMITFDKQSANELNRQLQHFHHDISNLRIMNFHRWVLRLASKHGLRLNKNSKQSFNIEFNKVFEKVARIYEGKHFYKAVLVDESENFSEDNMRLLRNICQVQKSFFIYSVDEPKQLSPVQRQEGKQSTKPSTVIHTAAGYRQSQKITEFSRRFQTHINEFAALELERIEPYFDSYEGASPVVGGVALQEYDSTEEELTQLRSIVRGYLDQGVLPSEIGILYPFHVKITRDGVVDSRSLIREALAQDDCMVQIATDASSNFVQSGGIMLSNIFNFKNLDRRIIIFCQLDTLYASGEEEEPNGVRRMLNILYTGMGRARQNLHLLVKRGADRPAIIDLLVQSAVEEC